MEEALRKGGLVLLGRLDDVAISTCKVIATEQKRKFTIVEDGEYSRQLSKKTWPLLVVHYGALGPQKMRNLMKKRLEYKSAPLVVVQDTTCKIALLPEMLKEAAFISLESNVELQMIEAVIVASVYVLAHCLQRRRGEAAGRPEKAKLEEVIVITQTASAVLLGQNVPSINSIKGTITDLVKRKVLDSLPQAFAYGLDVNETILNNIHAEKLQRAKEFYGVKYAFLRALQFLTKQSVEQYINVPYAMEGYIPFYKSHTGPTVRNSRTTCSYRKYIWLKFPQATKLSAKYKAAMKSYKRAKWVALRPKNKMYRKRLYNQNKRRRRRRAVMPKVMRLHHKDSPYSRRKAESQEAIRNFVSRRKLFSARQGELRK